MNKRITIFRNCKSIFSNGLNIFGLILLLILSLVLSGCAPPQQVYRFEMEWTEPISTLNPTPTPIIEVCELGYSWGSLELADWGWDPGILKVVGPQAWSYCDDLVAANSGVFYAPRMGNLILCDFQGAQHRFTVWADSNNGIASEFCIFLGDINDLP